MNRRESKVMPIIGLEASNDRNSLLIYKMKGEEEREVMNVDNRAHSLANTFSRLENEEK
jgi:hypothetical protein